MLANKGDVSFVLLGERWNIEIRVREIYTLFRF